MMFRDRQDAGRQLAKHLMKYANLDDVVVLGIPRGGVTVAFEVAMALRAPLDIFLSRKLGVPGQEELAFGAVAAGDGRFLDEDMIATAGISSGQIERITQATRLKLEERARLYRGGRTALSVEGRTVILVDDGIATGASVYAAIRALRQMNPKKLVVAAPVAPVSTCNWLRPETDELVVPYEPDYFYAVGQFYDRFPQVEDQEVVTLLRRAEQAFASKAHQNQNMSAGDPPFNPTLTTVQHNVSIPVGNLRLEGTLTLPQGAQGIVLFVHGSGSSAHSTRNRYVADDLHTHGLATLLFDLLTQDEDIVDRRTAELRFNIPLLAERLIAVTHWIGKNEETRSLAVGYFGASTGAAAALVSAARLSGLVSAVVSRGGRPDLAADALAAVRAPTLLIVGGLDEAVVTLNRQALAQLKCQAKRLIIVPGATHLFEEPGALDEVARLASAWLVRYLLQAGKDNELNTVGAATSKS